MPLPPPLLLIHITQKIVHNFTPTLETIPCGSIIVCTTVECVMCASLEFRFVFDIHSRSLSLSLKRTVCFGSAAVFKWIKNVVWMCMFKNNPNSVHTERMKGKATKKAREENREKETTAATVKLNKIPKRNHKRLWPINYSLVRISVQ